MNIKEFVKLPNNATLVKTDYGTHETKVDVEENILDKIEGWQASGVSEREIKDLVENFIRDYERVGHETKRKAREFLQSLSQRNSRRGM